MDRRESLDQAAPLPGIPSDSHAGRREKAGAAADSGAANRLAGRLSASGGAATLTRQASSLGTSRVQIDRNVQKRHSGAPIRQISISKRLSMYIVNRGCTPIVEHSPLAAGSWACLMKIHSSC